MAKSNRRKKQDRDKAAVRRAEQQRRHVKAERERQSARHFEQLNDPSVSPADVAGILAAEFPDRVLAADMMRRRMSLGVPAEEITETARVLLEGAAPEPPGVGALAVAALAAHLSGDEDAEHDYARELLARADAAGDRRQRMAVIDSAAGRDHPGETCELIGPYLREHPDDGLAADIYARALAKAYVQAEPGQLETTVLERYGDRSGADALDHAVGEFAERTQWGAIILKFMEEEQAAPERLSERSDFGEQEDGEDGQLVWWGEPAGDRSAEPVVLHYHDDGSAHVIAPADDEEERIVLGRLTPEPGRVRVRVNSQARLKRLLRILKEIGAAPKLAEVVRSQPSIDFAWGPVPGEGPTARQWAEDWAGQAVAVLDFHTPRHAAEGGANRLRLEGLLRQLEYQSALSGARGGRPVDTAWLRAELGLGVD